MIPRTKVNYTFGDLLGAISVTEHSRDYRMELACLLREYLGEKHVLLTPSGRGAMYFMLRALPQRRVIVPAYTCKAVVEAALFAGKEVVYVEAEPDGFNIDLAAMERAIDRDSVIIATHQFGIPCDIEAVRDLCRRHRAFLVEDVAAALGSRVGGRLTGTFGDGAFYSFDSTKLITVPLKGGFLTVRDAAIFQRVCDIYHAETKPMSPVKKLRLLASGVALLLLQNHVFYRTFHKLNFEWRGRFTADGPELNRERDDFYTADFANWQARMAARQLRNIDQIIATRRRRYAEFLSELNDCRAFLLPPRDDASEWAPIRFPIRVCGDKLDYYRRAVQRGVDCAFSFTFVACPDEFRRARLLASAVLDLPFYHKLTDREMECVVSVLHRLESEALNES